MCPMDKIRSLGLKSDLMIASHKSLIKETKDYVVVKSPQNPGYYWGNYLIFKYPPALLDAQLCNAHGWEYLFHREFAEMPGINHVAFTWDSPEGLPGDSEEFVALGFSLEETEVLTATDVYPPLYASDRVRIREITTVEQWDAVLELMMLTRDRVHEEHAHRIYLERKVENYRAMAMKKAGAWFGAFIGNELVGTLGMFTGNGVGRFQHVVTHPAYRRQGICSTLVYEIASLALTRDDVEHLVIEAEANEAPARIYKSLGFKHTETLFSLQKINNVVDQDAEITQKMRVQPSI